MKRRCFVSVLLIVLLGWSASLCVAATRAKPTRVVPTHADVRYGPLKGIPLPESASSGVLIHHAYFGKALKERLDEVGVPNRFVYGEEGRTARTAAMLAWLSEYLALTP